MKLYFEMIKLIFKKYVLRMKSGKVVKDFALNMGIVYIKLAQILATQNYGSLFTEEDREELSVICENLSPIPYSEIEQVLKREYGADFKEMFLSIDEKPLGSASISQVHRAVLKNGKEVVIKIKRKDVAKKIDRDIEQLRGVMEKFGFLIKFKNMAGGNYALDMYLNWIKQEVDFKGEVKNIRRYEEFAREANERLKSEGKIIIPKVYAEYCTENVIVMDYIDVPTINKLSLTDENKVVIARALNYYIRASFSALLNDLPVVFHGDPHSGNICVDRSGNIYFLDMGLIFELNAEEVCMCRKFFLAAYSKNYEKLYEMLVPYGTLDDEKKAMFKENCRRYCETIGGKEITFYFVEMINILFGYDLVPPKFLFGMAKAFLCVNGISKFSGNDMSAEVLLQKQTMEFLLRRSLDDTKKVIGSGIKQGPKVIKDILENGIISTLAQIPMSEAGKDFKHAIEDLREAKRLLEIFYKENSRENKKIGDGKEIK